MKNIKRFFNVAYHGLFRRDCDLSYGRTLAAIEKLAQAVEDYNGDINWCLGECTECTLDALLVGAYWFCTDYHGGQWSDEYRLQCVIGQVFNPGMTSLEKESSEQDVYDALVENQQES